MSNVFGKDFSISIFGESHSKGIGVIIDGIPAGFKIDMDSVMEAMGRRAPNKSVASTKRSEEDIPEVLSGCVDGIATGTPLAAIIRNSDAKSKDYDNIARLMRPGHADYTGHIKYNGFNDVRGGGHFSGRLTAPIVFAGSIARQILQKESIHIGAHIKNIASIEDEPFAELSKEHFEGLEQKEFYVNSDQAGDRMQAAIYSAFKDSNSVGGTITCAVIGAPVGLGEPFFDSVESELAHLLFSIPAVKGVEFGCGFSFADMLGSEANDPLSMKDGKISFDTNNNAGINGGLTNGMPVLFNTVIKPTASIAKPQQTVDIYALEDAELTIKGRHDACIVPRAVEVIKSAAAIVFADLLARNR